MPAWASKVAQIDLKQAKKQTTKQKQKTTKKLTQQPFRIWTPAVEGECIYFYVDYAL